jgi:hypothetical protein
MTLRALAVSLCVSLLVASSGLAQSAETMQKLLDKEALKLAAWGSDPAVVAAVKAQNAKRVPLETIKALDARWVAGKAEELARQTTTGPCADRLRELAGTSPAYGETFVMDDQGAIVCATVKTSDYWQGDEAKWERAYAGGKGAVFIDRPRFDDSAAARWRRSPCPSSTRAR